MANPFDGLDPDAVLEQLRRQAEDLETKAAQLRTELTNATAKATSPDGAVTVTLSPTGALQNITFTAAASKVPPEKLGPLVMRTVQAAQLTVSERVSASLTDQFGGTETMDFITQFMPKPQPPPTRRAHDEDEDGAILRKRKGGRPQSGPDNGGGLLR
ncbi:YbaB/EbfC family nucleoid-associated protein [Actinophytocola sp. NPDC049390]|uniref:YbaB/EbfC family nucleoid-associated protein n=1 Tax=Actinophytocola sp. NPDC049390 TaxID=3363894 RepID=UPI0037BAA916